MASNALPSIQLAHFDNGRTSKFCESSACTMIAVFAGGVAIGDALNGKVRTDYPEHPIAGFVTTRESLRHFIGALKTGEISYPV